MNEYGYVADFETLNDNTEYTYVWAWALCNIENSESVELGTSIVTFIDRIKNIKKIYFHNANFDCSFIIDYLFRNGFKCVETGKRENKSFSIIKSDTNKLYLLDITWSYKSSKKFTHTQILDSYKKLPFSVDSIAKAWNLPISKLKIDYKQHREENGMLTNEEKEYIKNDVIIIAKALYSLLSDGNIRMTIGADAIAHFRATKNKEDLKKLLPAITIEEDEFFRKAYKGGFTYVNEKYKNKEVKSGLVFDVNSLYPSRMYFCPMPCGKPKYYKGAYKQNKLYPLYIAHIIVNFEIKKDHIPCIQLKNNLSFMPTEYIKSTNNESVDLYLSSVDYELFIQQYNIISIDFVDGFMFKTCKDLFKEYIDYFMEIKKNSTGAKRTEAKLFLNNLYGKFGTNPVKKSKIAYYDEELKIVKYRLNEETINTPPYTPLAVFITAYARYLTITSAQQLYQRFIYADTDSLHLEGLEIPDNIDIDDKELGKWAHEATFTRAKFIRAKTYIEEINNELKVTCAGLPARSHSQVTWENFHSGTEYGEKLIPKVVKGGTILVESTFKIK